MLKFYDERFSKIPQITIPPRLSDYKLVYHLYIIFVKDRDALFKILFEKGIEAKVHYPKPMYLQKLKIYLNIKKEIFYY